MLGWWKKEKSELVFWKCTNILSEKVLTDILSSVEFINTYKGLRKDSDLAFFKKLD